MGARRKFVFVANWLRISRRIVPPKSTMLQSEMGRLIDTHEPICVASQEACIWSRLLIRFWLKKIDFDGFETNHKGSYNVLQSLPVGRNPEIICKYSSIFFSIFLCQTNLNIHVISGIFRFDGHAWKPQLLLAISRRY